MLSRASTPPRPAVAARGTPMIGKVVCALEELPPGIFRDHPCCCVAANEAILTEQPAAVTALLAVLIEGTRMINADLDVAVAAACRWIGTTAAVEQGLKIRVVEAGVAEEDISISDREVLQDPVRGATGFRLWLSSPTTGIPLPHMSF